MNINEYIESIKPKIQDFKNRGINEAQTKEWLIRPFFETLNWSFSNPDEVVPEDDDGSGRRPDYGFYFNKKIKFFVEAKPITTNIDDTKIINEKLSYCNNANVPFLIITNGVDYRIYYTGLKGSNKEKLLQEFSLNDEIDDEIINKLFKDSFENDLLYNYAKSLSVFSNVKTAIEKIFQNPTKKIIETINVEIKEILGHKFGDDDIKEALKHFNLEISEEIYSTDEDYENTIKKEIKNEEPSNWSIEYQFKNGKWSNSFNLYNKLKDYLKNNNINFSENPTKFYIGMIHNDKNFFQIHGQKAGIKVWIDIAFNELSEQEKLKARDVSQIGHWGMGQIECIIKNENDFDWILGIIKKSFEKIK